MRAGRRNRLSLELYVPLRAPPGPKRGLAFARLLFTVDGLQPELPQECMPETSRAPSRLTKTKNPKETRPKKNGTRS